MADQTIRIDLIARASTQAFGKVNAQMQSLGRSARHAADNASVGMGRIGAMSATAGTALLVGVGGALAVGAKAAIDFESAFAGVRKTVDASEETFSRLARGLRDLALDIPVGVGELTKIAELGGQLGIPADKIEAFTEVIAKLAATTNLDIEEAATTIARFANVMGTSLDDFDKLGATVVDLGNNFATTESEILTFGQRLSGIGVTVGLTESDVLGLATAFSSLGEPAERGATAVQRTFIKMLQAVGQGGEKLALFAEVAGTTAEEFSRIFKEDPVEAFIAFEKGIGAITDEGGDATQVLKDLGLGSQRVTTLLLKGGAAWEQIADAVELANEAFIANTALDEEAGKRFETTASQIKLMGNAFRDLNIEMGQATDGFVNFGVRALREFFILMQDNLAVIEAMIPFIVALAGAKVLGKLGNAFFNMGIKVGKSTPVLRAFAGGLNRVMMGARVLGGGLAVFAIGVGLVGAAMAAHKAKQRQYAEGLEGLVDTLVEFNSGLITAKGLFEAFNDVLGQPTGLFDRVIDLDTERQFLADLGTTAESLVLLAITDFGQFHRFTGDILEDQQDILDGIAETIDARTEPGMIGGPVGSELDIIEATGTRMARFRRIVEEITAATQNLRAAERLRQQEADLESGFTQELAFSGMAPPIEPGSRASELLDEFYSMTADEYDEFLTGMVEDTEAFGGEFGAAWTETITNFTDQFFDWSTAWDGYKQVVAISLTDMTTSIDNWVNDQERLLDASLHVYAVFGEEAGEFFDQLDVGLQRDLAATLATEGPEAMEAKIRAIFAGQESLLGFEFRKFMASAPAGARKGLEAWGTYFDTTVGPLLEEAGEEGSDRYMNALIDNFAGFKIEMLKKAPALAESFNELVGQALEQIDSDFTLFDIEALTRNMTTIDKLRFFTQMGIDWKLAIVLAFGDLPVLLGGVGAAAGKAIHNRFSSELRADSPSKVFMEIGRGVHEGFRLGLGDMSKTMQKSAMGMVSVFPEVPSSTIAPQFAPKIEVSVGSSQPSSSNTTFNFGDVENVDEVIRKVNQGEAMRNLLRKAEIG